MFTGTKIMKVRTGKVRKGNRKVVLGEIVGEVYNSVPNNSKSESLFFFFFQKLCVFQWCRACVYVWFEHVCVECVWCVCACVSVYECLYIYAYMYLRV